MNIQKFYETALAHQKSHDCSAMPYESGALLTSLAVANKAKSILEVGTGIGYSTVCLALAKPDVHIDTIDKSAEHIELARKYTEEFGVSEQITFHKGFAEDILSTFAEPFDLIFYDGFIPQKKFVEQFYELLCTGGMLVTTNLYLGDESGGRYVKLLNDESQWQTGIIQDTSLSVKI